MSPTIDVGDLLVALRAHAIQPYLGQGRNNSGRVPAVFAYLDGTNPGNSITGNPPGLLHDSTGNYLNMRWNAERATGSDTDNMHVGVISQIVIRSPGWYALNAHIIWSNNATGIRALKFNITPLNGAAYAFGETVVQNTGAGAACAFTVAPPALPLLAGDIIQAQALQNSGGNLTLLNVAGASPSISVVKVGNL